MRGISDAMAHAYCRPIAVTVAADGRPAAFIWHDVGYRVRAVFTTWHLRDRWWEEDAASLADTDGGASDRTYYRLRCVSASGQAELVCEIYHDAVCDRWVLERIYD